MNTVLNEIVSVNALVAVAEVTWIVVVQQIVVARFAVGIDRLAERLKIIHDLGDTRLSTGPRSCYRIRRRNEGEPNEPPP